VTGVPRYDQLFANVHSSLIAVQEARSEEAEARAALARRLGLTDAVSVEVLGARLRERTAHLAEEGLTLELEFTGIDDVDGLEPRTETNIEAAEQAEPGEATDESDTDQAPPTATLRTPGREPLRRELRLLEPLAQAALSGATLYVNMAHERRHTEHLLAEVAELEGRADASFVDAGERVRVRAKLAEAKSLLPQLSAQAREVSGSADLLISLLDEAANTAPVSARRRAPSPPRDSAPRPAPVKPPAPAAVSPSVNAPATGASPPAAAPSPSPAPPVAPMSSAP
jgi:hypothetical protein